MLAPAAPYTMNTIRAFVLLMISAAALPAAAPIEDMKDAKTVLSEVAEGYGCRWPEDTALFRHRLQLYRYARTPFPQAVGLTAS